LQIHFWLTLHENYQNWIGYEKVIDHIKSLRLRFYRSWRIFGTIISITIYEPS